MDKAEDTIDAPEGYNIKRYGVFEGKYGRYKQRINPVVTDVESEIAVYLLVKRLGVPCCPAVRTGKDTIFSAFLYNFSQEYVVHFRRLFGGKRGDNEYRNLLMVRPQYRDDITRMILLDFITRQDDRHLSNIAMKISGDNETVYPLYDNGRSLFYEDTEEMVEKAISDIPGYATRFGHSGTYWDHVREIAFENHAWRNLIDFDVSKEEIQNILIAVGFTGYRLAGSIIWIAKVLSILKKL